MNTTKILKDTFKIILLFFANYIFVFFIFLCLFINYLIGEVKYFLSNKSYGSNKENIYIRKFIDKIRLEENIDGQTK